MAGPDPQPIPGTEEGSKGFIDPITVKHFKRPSFKIR